jgi:hypothetical protein
VSRTWVGLLYAAVMIATIVAVDLAFLRDDAVRRLIVNICLVVGFGAFYLLVVRRG